MWFSNRRAKWRREEKLRTHRRDLESVGPGLGVSGGGGGVGGGVGLGAAGRMASSVVNGPGGTSGFAAAANGVYHASLVHQPLASMAAAAAVADQYRYPECVHHNHNHNSNNNKRMSVVFRRFNAVLIHREFCWCRRRNGPLWFSLWDSYATRN